MISCLAETHIKCKDTFIFKDKFKQMDKKKKI